MTASANIKTPTMELPMMKGLPDMEKKAERVAQKLYRLKLDELLDYENGVTVTDSLRPAHDGIHAEWIREYSIKLTLADLKAIKQKYSITIQEIGKVVASDFTLKLFDLIQKDSKKAGASLKVMAEKKKKKDSSGEADEEGDVSASKKADKEADVDEDEGEEEDADEDDAEQGTFRVGGKKQMVGYDEEEDNDEVKAAESEGGSEEESESDSSSESDNSDEDMHKDTKASPSLESSRSSGVVSLDAPPKVSEKKNFIGIYMNVVEGWLEVKLKYEAHRPKMLMVALAQSAASSVLLRYTKGINNCMVNASEEFGVPAVMTEGVNFHSAWALKKFGVDVNHIVSNDVAAIIKTYGVEAGRCVTYLVIC